MTLVEFYEQTKENIDKVIERYGNISSMHICRALVALEQKARSEVSIDEEGKFCYSLNPENLEAYPELLEQSKCIAEEIEKLDQNKLN